MNIKKTLKVAVLAGVVATLWALTPGCGASIGSYCNKICDCTGCNDSELDECVDTIDDAKRAAANEGCSSEFDALLACSNNELTCDDEQVQVDGCDSENEALFQCSPDIVGIGSNACERAVERIVAKIESCGGFVEPGPDGGAECSPEAGAQSLCYAECYDPISCDCLGFGDPSACSAEESSAYNDCLITCSEQ